MKKKTIISGAVVEQVIYPAAAGKGTRAPRSGNSDPQKQEHNNHAALRTVDRALNTNFGPDDLFVTLTYDKANYEQLKTGMPASINEVEQLQYICTAAKHQLRLYLKRLRRAAQRENIQLTYIVVTSQVSPDTGEYKRVHHHLVVCGDAEHHLKPKWGKGDVWIGSVIDEPDHQRLAKYLLNQGDSAGNSKRYTLSRNLRKPDVRIEDCDDVSVSIPEDAQVTIRTPTYARYTR